MLTVKRLEFLHQIFQDCSTHCVSTFLLHCSLGAKLSALLIHHLHWIHAASTVDSCSPRLECQLLHHLPYHVGLDGSCVRITHPFLHSIQSQILNCKVCFQRHSFHLRRVMLLCKGKSGTTVSTLTSSHNLVLRIILQSACILLRSGRFSFPCNEVYIKSCSNGELQPHVAQFASMHA